MLSPGAVKKTYMRLEAAAAEGSDFDLDVTPFYRWFTRNGEAIYDLIGEVQFPNAPPYAPHTYTPEERAVVSTFLDAHMREPSKRPTTPPVSDFPVTLAQARAMFRRNPAPLERSGSRPWMAPMVDSFPYPLPPQMTGLPTWAATAPMAWERAAPEGFPPWPQRGSRYSDAEVRSIAVWLRDIWPLRQEANIIAWDADARAARSGQSGGFQGRVHEAWSAAMRTTHPRNGALWTPEGITEGARQAARQALEIVEEAEAYHPATAAPSSTAFSSPDEHVQWARTVAPGTLGRVLDMYYPYKDTAYDRFVRRVVLETEKTISPYMKNRDKNNQNYEEQQEYIKWFKEINRQAQGIVLRLERSGENVTIPKVMKHLKNVKYSTHFSETGNPRWRFEQEIDGRVFSYIGEYQSQRQAILAIQGDGWTRCRDEIVNLLKERDIPHLVEFDIMYFIVCNRLIFLKTHNGRRTIHTSMPTGEWITMGDPLKTAAEVAAKIDAFRTRVCPGGRVARPRAPFSPGSG